MLNPLRGELINYFIYVIYIHEEDIFNFQVDVVMNTGKEIW